MTYSGNAVEYYETGEVESPCVRECCLDDRNICVGCGRSLAEILEWHKASSARRGKILDLARQRKQ